jgi:hypothetical protein
MKTTTTDLMYAAFLIVLGCTIDEIENTGRYSKIHIFVPERATELLQQKAGRLVRLAERADTLAEIGVVYDMSMMKDIADQYFLLKKKIARLK